MNFYNNNEPNRKIAVISLSFIGIYIFQLINGFEILKDLLNADAVSLNFTLIFYVLTFLYIPVSVLLFYRKYKIGWILLTFTATNSILNSIFVLFIELSSKPYINTSSTEFKLSNLSFSFFVTTLLYGIGIWNLCGKDLKIEYKIGKKTMLMTIIAGFLSFIIFTLYDQLFLKT